MRESQSRPGRSPGLWEWREELCTQRSVAAQQGVPGKDTERQQTDLGKKHRRDTRNEKDRKQARK